MNILKINVFVCMLASRCISLNLWRKIFGRHMLPGRNDGDKLFHFISSMSWTNGLKTSDIRAGRMVSKSIAKHHEKLHMNRHFAFTHTHKNTQTNTHTCHIYGVLFSTTSSRYGQKNMPRRICHFFFFQAVTKFKLQKKLIKNSIFFVIDTKTWMLSTGGCWQWQRRRGNKHAQMRF